MAARAQLSSRQRRFLQDQGYLVVRSLLDQAVLTRIGDRLQELVRQTVAAWADEPSLDTTEGCVVAEFDVTRPDFAPCHQHPLLADAATTVLGDPWHVRNLDLRAPIPGCGEQGLHPDYAERRTEGPWQTLSAMWCVTPFTRDSGPLRVIPGSHRRPEPPIDTEHGYATGMGPHPDEVKIIAPAGSVILFNAADLWHSGTFNYTPAARLALTVHFDPGVARGGHGRPRPSQHGHAWVAETSTARYGMWKVPPNRSMVVPISANRSARQATDRECGRGSTSRSRLVPFRRHPVRRHDLGAGSSIRAR